MKTVYKYPLRLADVQAIRGRGLGKVLMGGFDSNRQLSVWVEADTDVPDVEIMLAIVGTGHPRPAADEGIYVNSIIDGAFVWHLYQYLDH